MKVPQFVCILLTIGLVGASILPSPWIFTRKQKDELARAFKAIDDHLYKNYQYWQVHDYRDMLKLSRKFEETADQSKHGNVTFAVNQLAKLEWARDTCTYEAQQLLEELCETIRNIVLNRLDLFINGFKNVNDDECYRDTYYDD